MHARTPLLTLLFASLVLSGEATAGGSRHDAALAGAVVGAVIGGAIVASSRYDRVPIYVEIGPPRVIYYDYAHPGYYAPPPRHYRPYYRAYEPHRWHKPHHYRHHHRHHHRHYRHGGYYAPRW